MPTYLTTIRETRRDTAGVRLFPGIHIAEVAQEVKSMQQGARLELRFEGRGSVESRLLSYGIRLGKDDAGDLIYAGDPQDPEIILMLPPETLDDDLRIGTTVWLL